MIMNQLLSKDFQETFHVVVEDYIQTFHSPERQKKRKVTGRSVIAKICEKICFPNISLQNNTVIQGKF